MIMIHTTASDDGDHDGDNDEYDGDDDDLYFASLISHEQSIVKSLRLLGKCVVGQGDCIAYILYHMPGVREGVQ